MFKRISIILLILFTLLAFTVGASATAVTMVKADDGSYIRWMADAVVILEINSDGTTTLATTPSATSVLMGTTDAVQFYDSGLSIAASGDGVLTINSDGTLVNTVTTSVTTTTPTMVHAYDASNLVTTTVSSTGTVLVATTGASTGAYEIATDDGAITLDSAAGISLEATTVTTFTGDLDASDAAGPSIIDETVTSTNPTILPNKVEEDTGLGWEADTIHIVLGGSDEYDFSTAALEMNSNNLTEVGTYSGVGKVLVTPGAAGTFLDFDLNAAWLGGTMITANFSASTTPTQAIIGINLDLGTNVVAASEEHVKGLDIALPTFTVDTASIYGVGIEITGGTYTLSTSGVSTWTGVDITIPTMVETAGTLTAVGVKIAGGTLTTDPISYGIQLTGTFVTGIQFGVSGTPIDFVLHSDRALEIYASTNATGGNVMPVYVSLATDGTCTARAGEFVLTATAQLGDYANPLKSYLDVSDTSGGTGTISGLCVEVLYPEEQQTGSIALLELEAVVNTGYVYTDYTSVIMFQLGGTDSSSFQDGAYFLYVGGLTSATGDTWYNNTLMCSIIGTDWYLPFSTTQGTYTTLFPVSVTVAAGTAITVGTSVTGISMAGAYSTAGISIDTTLAARDDYAIYVATTCAALSGTQAHNAFLGTMTGAGAVGATVYVDLTVSNVAAGGYVNALYVLMDFGATGSVVGLASAVCAELVLTTGAQSAGTYAVLELEMTCPATWAPTGGGQYTFIYASATGSTVTTYDTVGNFLWVTGLSSGDGKCLYNNTLRSKIGSTYWYLPFSSAQGSYTTAYPIVTTYAGTVFTATSTIATSSADHIMHLTVNDNSTISSGRNSGLYVEYVIGGIKTGGSECNAVSVRGTLTDSVGSFYAYHALINITDGKNFNGGLFYGYMSDIGSGTCANVWAMKLDRVTTTQGSSRDMFLGFKAHGGAGRAKTIFYIEGTSNKIAEQFIMKAGAGSGSSDWFVTGVDVSTGYTCAGVLRVGEEAIIGGGVTTQYYIPLYTED